MKKNILKLFSGLFLLGYLLFFPMIMDVIKLDTVVAYYLGCAFTLANLFIYYYATGEIE